MQNKIKTVQQHILDEERMHPGATGDFTALLTTLTLAAKIISREVNKEGLGPNCGGLLYLRLEHDDGLHHRKRRSWIHARSKPGRVSSFPRKYSHARARENLQHQRREHAFLGRRHAAVHRASERGPEGSRPSVQLAIHRFSRRRFPSKFTEGRHLSLSWP